MRFLFSTDIFQRANRSGRPSGNLSATSAVQAGFLRIGIAPRRHSMNVGYEHPSGQFPVQQLLRSDNSPLSKAGGASKASDKARRLADGEVFQLKGFSAFDPLRGHSPSWPWGGPNEERSYEDLVLSRLGPSLHWVAARDQLP
jgi:hypothetical protein